MRRIAVTLTLLGVLPLSLPAGASAQVFDDGPADKEYAIPLKEAREKSGKKQDGDSGEAPSSRFGEGITTETEGDDSAQTGGTTSTGTEKQKDKSADAEAKEDEQEIAAAPSSSGDSGGGGTGADNSAALLTGGIALAVLLIGGAVALMARRTATDDV